MNGDVQSNLANLASYNREKVEDSHSRILKLQQEIILSGENLSPTRLLFQYTKALSKINRLKAFIVPKMKYLITFLDINGKYSVQEG